jgi:hypothetical protein
MNITLCVFATALIFARQAFAASDLDKPIEQTRPTIRTEIYRGREASGVCGNNTARLWDCVHAIQNKNVQQNTASDAFNAGLFFNIWLIASIHVTAVKKVTGQDEDVELAMQFFKEMKEYQTKLRIDNQALCEATRVSCKNVLPDMAEWESKLKAQ